MSDEITQPEQSQGPELVIHTIPMEFYGGKNPGVEQSVKNEKPPEETKSVSAPPLHVVVPVQPKLPPKPVVATTPAASASVGATTVTIVPPRPAWFLPAVVAGVVLVIGGGAAAYFAFTKKPPEAVPQPPELTVATTTQDASLSTVAETTPEPEPVKPPASLSLIAPHSFTDSLDGDADGVTDVEEELWGTNPTLVDSDGDTYADGVEVRNLYSPVGVAPQRLVDAGVVSTYVNTEYKYTVLHPKPWLAQDVDKEKKETVFTAVSGEFVAINVLEFPLKTSFVDWFAQQFPDEKLQTYAAFTNRMKVAGILSVDGAVALITDGAHVYLLRYDGGSRSQINYRASFQMMVQSFKPASVATPIEFLPKTVVAPRADEIIPLATLLASSTVSSTTVEIEQEITVAQESAVASTTASTTASTSSPTTSSTAPTTSSKKR